MTEKTPEEIWAFAQENQGLLKMAVKRAQHRGVPHRFQGQDGFEELCSEGLIYLHKAAARFDPDRGFTFGTFATAVIWNGLQNIIRKELVAIGGSPSSGTRTRYAWVVSLEGLMEGRRGRLDNSDYLDVLPELAVEDEGFAAIEAAEVGAYWFAKIAELDVSDVQREAAYLRLDGLEWRQVGDKLGMSRQGAQQAATKVFNLLRGIAEAEAVPA